MFVGTSGFNVDTKLVDQPIPPSAQTRAHEDPDETVEAVLIALPLDEINGTVAACRCDGKPVSDVLPEPSTEAFDSRTGEPVVACETSNVPTYLDSPHRIIVSDALDIVVFPRTHGRLNVC